MKELVKPQRLEKEYNDAQAYCEGGNDGYDYCPTSVRCDRVNYRGCTGWSSDGDEDELLF